jgi:hypothetical protein
MERDDSRATPECEPSCVSGNWTQADLRRVLYEVTRCSKSPVYVAPEIAGKLTVSVKQMSCSQAIAHVAEAAGLKVLSVKGATDRHGKPLPEDAIALAGSASPRSLVDVSSLRPRRQETPWRDANTLHDDGWSRDVADEGSSYSDSTARGSSTDSRRTESSDQAGAADEQSARRRQLCRDRCSPGWSSCVSGCTGGEVQRESCLNRCRLIQDACQAPCESL